MSNLKKLQLDRDKINSSIESFSENIKIKNIEEKGINTLYTIEIDSKEIKLSFYFNTNGTTTINPNVGIPGTREVGTKIAEHIKTHATFGLGNEKNVDYSTKDIDEEKFSLLLEYIKEILEFNINVEERTVHQKTFIITSSKHGDKFNINRYTNGNTHFQGKPLKIYNEIYPLLCELINENDIFKLNEDLYSITINKNDIKDELSHKLPVAGSHLNDTIKKMLTGSITLKKIDIDLDDYSSFVFGALRALEAFIKDILFKKGIRVKNTNSFVDVFFEDKRRGTFEMTRECELKINCQKTRNALIECFEYYSNQRHGLFHADSIASMSRLIENKTEADEIINNVLDIIERSYCETL
ncbi:MULTISPECIES: type II toxin-antitoxin system RnlA family toxin [Aliarcobacter]|uniref:Bacterial toxin RNase RnlA/LsoA DBD domain-containing protein n=1 Tax=Aliarcobacter butzleri L351 TaxID=1447259 RepID=A0A837J417_9BACT|nr:type II toxin-antitoxin system RnlA family toxin [Aliarcobacter butzleri]KLE00238.1 hypothetical protein AF76_08200 [Aliarcobacter butzleri L351]KLE13256.1 hypothetical protein AF75_04520 [Aliarcobacter butzleri L350]MCG3674103.1 type II toxin-antitoxin system RnlA family toxin [Aliarcobacter butzleri]